MCEHENVCYCIMRDGVHVCTIIYFKVMHGCKQQFADKTGYLHLCFYVMKYNVSKIHSNFLLSAETLFAFYLIFLSRNHFVVFAKLLMPIK